MSIKKNYFYNTAYQILAILIPLITTPYISRVLGAGGVGEYSYAYSVAGYFVMFILLGLNVYGNRTVATNRDDKELRTKTYWSIYFLQLFIATIVFFLYFAYIVYKKFDTMAVILAIYVVSGAFDINWFFNGMEKFKLTVIRNSVIKILNTIAIFIFVRKSSDVYVYAVVMTLGIIVSNIAIWPYLKKEVGFYLPSFKEIFVHLKPNLVLFLPVVAISLYKIMDKIMLGALTDTVQVGYYESAEKITSLPIAFITSLGTVMIPRTSNLVAQGKKRESRKYMGYSMVFAIALSSLLAFGIMGVSKEFVPIFYGKGFEVCVTLYMILMPSSVFIAIANVVRTQYLIPNKMDKHYVASVFFGAVVNIILNLILIPRSAAVGAAIATFFAEASVCIFQCVDVCKLIPVGRYILKGVPFLILATIMFAVIFFISLPFSPLISLILKVIIGGCIYVVGTVIIIKATNAN